MIKIISFKEWLREAKVTETNVLKYLTLIKKGLKSSKMNIGAVDSKGVWEVEFDELSLVLKNRESNNKKIGIADIIGYRYENELYSLPRIVTSVKDIFKSITLMQNFAGKNKPVSDTNKLASLSVDKKIPISDELQDDADKPDAGPVISNEKYEAFREGDLLRIYAKKDFGTVKKGDKGGLIEKESNLSAKGNCWVYLDSKVYGKAKVYGDAEVYMGAKVYGDAEVFENAIVYDHAEVYGKAQVYGDTALHWNTKVYDNAKVYGKAQVYMGAKVYGDAEVFENAQVYGKAQVYMDAKVYGDAEVYGKAEVFGKAQVYGNAKVYDNAEVFGNDSRF